MVEQAILEHPDWFDTWTEIEFDELYSRFGTGGPIANDAVEEVVNSMNRNREVHRKVALVMESEEAELLATFVQMLYARIATAP